MLSFTIVFGLSSSFVHNCILNGLKKTCYIRSLSDAKVNKCVVCVSEGVTVSWMGNSKCRKYDKKFPLTYSNLTNQVHFSVVCLWAPLVANP